MKIILIEIKYCPLCGKSIFKDKFVKQTKEEDLFDFMKQDGEGNYKCVGCGYIKDDFEDLLN